MTTRLEGVDALRALAMTAVIAQHCGLLPFGWTGVWLFYVISGYVITIGIESRADGHHPFGARYLEFMRLRMVRILPPLLVYVCLCCVYAWASGAWEQWLAQTPAILTFVYNAWMVFTAPAEYPRWAPYGHLWTISVEQQFYLAFPLLAMRLPDRWRVKACLVLIATAPLLRWIAASQMPVDWPVGHRAFAIYAASYIHADAFLLGALVAYQKTQAQRSDGVWAWLLPMAMLVAITYAVALLYANWSSGAQGVGLLKNIFSGILYGQGREVFVYTAVALLSTAALVSTLRGRSVGGARAQTWLAWIGRRSYSGYLIHLLILVCLQQLLGQPGTKGMGAAERAVLFAGTLMGTLCMSHLMYEWVERPVQRLFRQRSSRAGTSHH
jgi:peptidoglycan/LPS O-acetylase OafA/YrhL